MEFSVGHFQVACEDHGQEDRVAVRQEEDWLGLAVFDGHDGPAVSNWLEKGFFSASSPAAGVPDVAQLFAAAERHCVQHFAKAGACAVAVVIDKRRGAITCGNVGDCMAVLDDDMLTTVHRATEPLETARIVEAGGWVSGDGRVFGILQPSRALGDRDLKKGGIPPPPLNKRDSKLLRKTGAADERRPAGDASKVVVAVPAVAQATLRPEGGVLVLGSDGLFDRVSPSACVKAARAARLRGESAAQVAEELCLAARERKSRDDISAVVCFYGPKAEPQREDETEKTMDNDSKLDANGGQEAATIAEAAKAAGEKEEKKKKKKKKHKKKKAPPAAAVAAPSVEGAAVAAKSSGELPVAMLVATCAAVLYVLVVALH